MAGSVKGCMAPLPIDKWVSDRLEKGDIPSPYHSQINLQCLHLVHLSRYHTLCKPQGNLLWVTDLFSSPSTPSLCFEPSNKLVIGLSGNMHSHSILWNGQYNIGIHIPFGLFYIPSWWVPASIMWREMLEEERAQGLLRQSIFVEGDLERRMVDELDEREGRVESCLWGRITVCTYNP